MKTAGSVACVSQPPKEFSGLQKPVWQPQVLTLDSSACHFSPALLPSHSPFFFWPPRWQSSSPFFSSPDSSDLVFGLSLLSLPSPFSCSFMSFLGGSLRAGWDLWDCGCSRKQSNREVRCICKPPGIGQEGTPATRETGQSSWSTRQAGLEIF